MIPLIKAIIAAFERNGIFSADLLGKKACSISGTISRYSTNIPGLDHFIVIDHAERGQEINFIFAGYQISLADVEKQFGAFSVNYNFRENYSEFKFNTGGVKVVDLYFIKANKFQVLSPGLFVETTSQGEAMCQARLEFNGFCLRIQP